MRRSKFSKYLRCDRDWGCVLFMTTENDENCHDKDCIIGLYTLPCRIGSEPSARDDRISVVSFAYLDNASQAVLNLLSLSMVKADRIGIVFLSLFSWLNQFSLFLKSVIWTVEVDFFSPSFKWTQFRWCVVRSKIDTFVHIRASAVSTSNKLFVCRSFGYCLTVPYTPKRHDQRMMKDQSQGHKTEKPEEENLESNDSTGCDI